MRKLWRRVLAGPGGAGLVVSLALLSLGGPVSGAGSTARATFAGGCFWCMESPFEKLEGVREVVSGYTGGPEKNPTYLSVSSGATGHLEAVEVTYDPEKVTYSDLLDVFWRQIDPTDDGGQFVDRGSQYLSAIFTHDEVQERLARESREKLEKAGLFDGPIVTAIRPAEPFTRAEEYHQDYYRKSSVKYKYYRWNSGRDEFLKKTWGSGEMKSEVKGRGNWKDFTRPPKEDLKKSLTPMQYRVTQEEGTEPPYQNEYHDSKREGIYVDIVSGEPLFSSLSKYDSKSGWPSFTQPIDEENIIEKDDRSFFSVRTEVRSLHGDSHLGHVFGDGPPPTGKRYCINSAALRFVPKEDLEKEGYGDYADLFR